MNNSNNIKILSWNVNGLRAIQKKRALHWIDIANPDILCLQETKLSEFEFEDSILFQKQFKKTIINNSFRKGFSGTMIYSDFFYKKKDFCTQIDIEKEGRIIEQHFDNLIIFNIYFPNGKLSQERLEYKLKFYENFLNYCLELKEKGNALIICGDFNTAYQDIDLKKSKIYSNLGFTDIERLYLKRFFDNGFIDTFRDIYGNIEDAYTLFPYRSKAREKNEGWRIDYILISEDLKNNLKDAFIYKDILGSDHCPIGIEIDLSKFISM